MKAAQKKSEWEAMKRTKETMESNERERVWNPTQWTKTWAMDRSHRRIIWNIVQSQQNHSRGAAHTFYGDVWRGEVKGKDHAEIEEWKIELIDWKSRT